MARAGPRGAHVSLRILNVAFPHAPVRADSVGGAEQVLARLDAALVAAGHRSCVLACAGSQTAGKLFAVEAPDGELDDARREIAWARYRDLIGRIVEEERIDVVHLHGIDFAHYAPRGVATLATLHLPLDWYDEAIWSLPESIHLHCVSESQQRARAHARLLKPIPNGVPMRAAAGVARRDYCVMLARICPEKGVRHALDAARAADAALLIAGHVYPYRAHLDYFQREVAPRLDARRRFIGPVRGRAKSRLLAGARALLAPACAPETSSLVAMEALAMGTPVIAYRAGALPHIVEHGRTGFLVEDAAGMAEAIRAARDIDPAACRDAARTRFSEDRMIADYFGVYAALAGRAA